MSKNWIPNKYKIVRYEIQQDNITIAYVYGKRLEWNEKNEDETNNM